MAKEFFKALPDTSTPLSPERLNGLLNGNEALGSIVVEDIECKNLFNKYSYTKGYLVAVTGELTSNGSYGASDYIPVKAGQNYYQQGTNAWYSVLYDSNHNFVSQINSKSFTPSQNGYMRTSFLLTDIDTVQVEKGSSASEVVPYKNFEGKTNIITGQECSTNECIDGKQVYVKRINCGALPNATTKTIETGLSNVNVIRLEGIAIYNEHIRPMPHFSTSSLDGGIALYLADYDIVIETGNDKSSFTGYVTIYYTK